MIPVFPYHIRRSADGQSGELLLQIGRRKSAFILHLSLEQARLLAVEMRGLATDHCPQHHLALSIAQTLGARISSVILRGANQGMVRGALQLEGDVDLALVEADVAAVLSLAIHHGLPIFMEGYQMPAAEEATAAQEPKASLPRAEIPDAFLDVIDSLDIS